MQSEKDSEAKMSMDNMQIIQHTHDAIHVTSYLIFFLPQCRFCTYFIIVLYLCEAHYVAFYYVWNAVAESN